MPLIRYEDHRFSRDNLAIVEQANELLADYAEDGLAVTLRQLYYRFVAMDLIPNSKQSYNKFGDVIAYARLAGLIDWEAIEDRARNLIAHDHWDHPRDIIKTAAKAFHVDVWQDQPLRCEVWVEKQALEGVVGLACSPLDVPYFACKGYTSQSEMWRASERFRRYLEERGQGMFLIHLGDHDPSGIDMTRDIQDRLSKTFKLGKLVHVQRIALNMDQIRRYRPPPNPAKTTDSRSGDYIEKYGESSWELDALEPRTLVELIQRSIKLVAKLVGACQATVYNYLARRGKLVSRAQAMQKAQERLATARRERMAGAWIQR